MAGVLAAAFSPAFAFLLAAQVVIGLSVGSASMVVPMYIGEAAPPRSRHPAGGPGRHAIMDGWQTAR
jgi:MFS family permease